MKNILSIIRHDLKKISGSVVAIVTVMGLCLVPCSYAWFNILSNWAPYESEATGRISVAVANADEGASAAGLTINVGDKIIEALEANDAIGWVFVEDDSSALEGVRAGDYYAALVIPEGFSRDVMSFTSGSLTNPVLKYYENEKKNAIAPKITGKAKTAVQEEVNAAFVETLASYVSDAASVAESTGMDPADIMTDLSEKTAQLGRDMNSCIVLSSSAASLTDAAGGLLDASDGLIDSTQSVLDQNDRLLDEAAKNVPAQEAKLEKIRKISSELISDASTLLETLNETVTQIITDILADIPVSFDLFINSGARDTAVSDTDAMQKEAAEQAETLRKAGYTQMADSFAQFSDQLALVSADLSALDTGMTMSERAIALDRLRADINTANSMEEDIKAQIKTDIDASIDRALANTKASVSAYRKTLKEANTDLGKVSSLMSKYGSSLEQLGSSVDGTTASLKALQSGSEHISGLLSNAAGNELINRLNGLLANDEAAVAEYLANPVKMEKKTFWPIENYGSAMAPFYTVLAQWVGSLLTAVLIKVRIRRREGLTNLKLHEWYFGRFGLYLLVGLAQGLVVAIGDLLYVHIQCLHPGLFLLSACFNGIVFMMINYALVFALDNIGLGAGVIILVLQVAGAGGTYPVEVLPQVLQVLYPFMPFRYAMDAMRECIGGTYNGTYWHCMGTLGLFFVFAVCFGMALYRPALRLNELIAESKAKSEIML